MKIYKFEEVLNDLADYFILGDPEYLLQYKEANNLPDDLLTEFTTQETGDIAVQQGVLVPLTGVENYPYTIYFNLSEETPELMKPGNNLQHKKDGYSLKVNNGRIYLYTIPYLNNYTEARITELKKYKHATIELPNGWYTVSILGGLVRQTFEIENSNGKTIESMEPAFEFLIQPSFEQPQFTADFLYRFKIITPY